jgi:hypothetical protein
MRPFLAVPFIAAFSIIIYAASPAAAQSDVTTISKDPNTGVTTTTTKFSGGTTKTEVFNPATNTTNTTTQSFDGKTATSTSVKDQTTGTVTTKWKDFDGITGTNIEETDEKTGNTTKTIERSDGSISVIKNNKDGNLLYKSTSKKGYREDWQRTNDGYKESTSFTYKENGKQYTENHSYESHTHIDNNYTPAWKSQSEETNDQKIIDGKTVRDVKIVKVVSDGKVSFQEWYEVIELVYKGEVADFHHGKGAQVGIKYRAYDFDATTGKTNVVHIELEDGTPIDKPLDNNKGAIEAKQQTETTAKTQKEPNKGHPKKESRRKKQTPKRAAKRPTDGDNSSNMSPETARTIGTIIDIGIDVGLNRVGRRGSGDHHDRGDAPKRVTPKSDR